MRPSRRDEASNTPLTTLAGDSANRTYPDLTRATGAIVIIIVLYLVQGVDETLEQLLVVACRRHSSGGPG